MRATPLAMGEKEWFLRAGTRSLGGHSRSRLRLFCGLASEYEPTKQQNIGENN
jgi:hypothetical protein